MTDNCCCWQTWCLHSQQHQVKSFCGTRVIVVIGSFLLMSKSQKVHNSW